MSESVGRITEADLSASAAVSLALTGLAVACPAMVRAYQADTTAPRSLIIGGSKWAQILNDERQQ